MGSSSLMDAKRHVIIDEKCAADLADWLDRRLFLSWAGQGSNLRPWD
jgi:hypothetical protein